MPYAIASKLVRVLNGGHNFVADELGSRRLPPPEPQILDDAIVSPLAYASPPTLGRDGSLLQQQQPLDILNFDLELGLTPGYTTHDDAGSDGDDTVHSPIKFYRVPNVFSADVGFSSSSLSSEGEDRSDGDLPETVDVVFNDFIQPWVLLALEFLGHDAHANDTAAYMEGETMTSVITKWVEGNWKC